MPLVGEDQKAVIQALKAVIPPDGEYRSGSLLGGLANSD
jgi:hypothetical protein